MKKNSKTFLYVLLALVVLIGAAGILYTRLSDGYGAGVLSAESPQPDTETSEAPLAPDFTVYDREGNEVQLSAFIGKPVVLNFWASWCGPCRSEMPDFEAAYQEFGDDIHFVMVNTTGMMDETQSAAEQFLAGEGYTFPVYYDLDLDAAATYGIVGIPTTYFIDADGRLVAYASSALDAETLQAGIDMIYG